MLAIYTIGLYAFQDIKANFNSMITIHGYNIEIVKILWHNREMINIK